jgi:hypothetical protein
MIIETVAPSTIETSLKNYFSVKKLPMRVSKVVNIIGKESQMLNRKIPLTSSSVSYKIRVKMKNLKDCLIKVHSVN